MPSATPPVDQFWLLTGPVPCGPFTVSEIHAKLTSGDATWQTPACPVGGAQPKLLKGLDSRRVKFFS